MVDPNGTTGVKDAAYLINAILSQTVQDQYNWVTVCLLIHDALPSYRHGVPPLNRSMLFIYVVIRKVLYGLRDATFEIRPCYLFVTFY